MRKVITVNIFNIIWNDEDYNDNNDTGLALPSFENNVALEVVYDENDEFDPAVEYKINEYLTEKYCIDVESFDWQFVCEEQIKENNMAKNKKKVQAPVNVVPATTEQEVKEVVTEVNEPVLCTCSDSMAKARELLNNAVKEVLDGIVTRQELLSIALRKVRATSVLTEEENEALDKLEIDVNVIYK